MAKKKELYLISPTRELIARIYDLPIGSARSNAIEYLHLYEEIYFSDIVFETDGTVKVPGFISFNRFTDIPNYKPIN